VAYEGSPETLAPLELLALTFVRPGELRSAEWSEFVPESTIWSIPAEKMKMRRPHRVPLAPRAVAILRELHAINGKGRFLFPSVRSAERCMSENTINAALRRLGFAQGEMTAHGFRWPHPRSSTSAVYRTRTPSSVNLPTSTTTASAAPTPAPTSGTSAFG
jgi:integrase